MLCFRLLSNLEHLHNNHTTQDYEGLVVQRQYVHPFYLVFATLIITLGNTVCCLLSEMEHELLTMLEELNSPVGLDEIGVDYLQYICPFTLIIGVLISFPVYDCHEFVFLYWLTIWFSHLRYHLYFMQHIFVTNKIKCYKFTINNQNRKILPNCNWLSTHKQCYQLTPHNQNTTLLPIYYRLSQHKTCYYVTIDSKHY